MKDHTPQNVGALVEGFFRQAGKQDALELGQVRSRWQAIVGPEIARVTWPAQRRGKTLWVHTRTAGMAQNFHFMASEVLAGIAAVLGHDKVKELKFRPGKLNRDNAAPSPSGGAGFFPETLPEGSPARPPQARTLRAAPAALRAEPSAVIRGLKSWQMQAGALSEGATEEGGQGSTVASPLPVKPPRAKTLRAKTLQARSAALRAEPSAVIRRLKSWQMQVEQMKKP